MSGVDLVIRRGCDLLEGGSSWLNLGDDLVGGPVPDEGLRILVAMLCPAADGIDEGSDAGEEQASGVRSQVFVAVADARHRALDVGLQIAYIPRLDIERWAASPETALRGVRGISMISPAASRFWIERQVPGS